MTRPRYWLCIGLAAALALLLGGVYWASRPGPRPVVPDGDDQAPAASDGPPWLSDLTAASGVSFRCRNGEEADRYTLLESLGGGVALIDFDGDGRLDLFAVGGGTFEGTDRKTLAGQPCKLYRNLGGWKFEDVTAKAGLERSWFYTHGVAVADYDRDGWPDLLVTGYNHLALFRNEPDGQGGRRFADVTQKAGLTGKSWFTSAGFGDLDGDGWPDLYVCTYADWSFQNDPVCPGLRPDVKRDVCPPQRFKPLVHFLYRNEKGTFRDVSGEHDFKAAGCGLGVVFVDVNDDRRPDVYVANDASDNFLFVNRGGRLEEKGHVAGVATDDHGRYNGSMGVDAADYDGSGRASLWVTNFEGERHALYQNLGRETFLYQSQAAGLGALSLTQVGFGTAFVDLDRDGWEDLVIANGHVLRYPRAGGSMRQLPVLLRNVEYRGRRFFRDVKDLGGSFFNTAAVNRGLAVGDLDDDGRPDLVIGQTNGPLTLLRNEAAPEARWLGLSLVGRDRRDVVGSTVVVETASRKLTRFVKGGGSYLSAGDPRVLVGLGDEEVRRVTVKWSWGEAQTWEGVGTNAYWELREGEKTARKTDLP